MQDFEVAPHATRPYYPANLLVQEKLDVRPRAVTPSHLVTDATGRIKSGTSLDISLGLSLQEVTAELKHQIQLRHSTYYEDDAIITHVSEFLAGSEVKGTSTTKPSATIPPPEFWEYLLIANMGLAFLYVWILGPGTEYLILWAMSAVMMGYILPFAAMGLALVVSYAVRRQTPTRLWRWFWILWAIFALFILLGALGTRLATQ